jgi:ribosomal protein L25 (general stress protein Ctc)
VSGDRITLEVKERGAAELGTRNVKRLRKEGLIPGVLYGKVTKPFVVGERELRSALTGPSGLHAIVDVVIDGQKTPHAVLKDYQRHPVRDTITHVDFHEVRLDQPIQATSRCSLVGEAPGAKVGGVVRRWLGELSRPAGRDPRVHRGRPLRARSWATPAARGSARSTGNVPGRPGRHRDRHLLRPRSLTEAEEAADEVAAEPAESRPSLPESGESSESEE